MTEYIEFWEHDNRRDCYWFCPVVDYRGEDDDFERMLPEWEDGPPPGWDEGVYLANPRTLIELFNLMRTHDIPALDTGLPLSILTRLFAARVRIISPEEVQP